MAGISLLPLLPHPPGTSGWGCDKEERSWMVQRAPLPPLTPNNTPLQSTNGHARLTHATLTSLRHYRHLGRRLLPPPVWQKQNRTWITFTIVCLAYYWQLLIKLYYFVDFLWSPDTDCWHLALHDSFLPWVGLGQAGLCVLIGNVPHTNPSSSDSSIINLGKSTYISYLG